MQTYHALLRHILAHGRVRPNRTGEDTIGVFGYQARFDLREGFPLVTTKKMFWRGIVAELLWFLSGDTHEHTLRDQGVHIWKEWATADQCARFGRAEGDLGPIYGWTWRRFGQHYDDLGVGGGFDQIAWLLDEIQKNPSSRRLIVSGWDPREASNVALPPCHTLFQFYVQDGELSCHLYQRSADAFLGVPWNIASYALLTHLIAHCTGLRVGEFVHSFGDLHVYQNHLAQVSVQLSREPRPLPQLVVHDTEIGDPLRRLLAIRYEDISLHAYDPHPALAAPVAV